MFNRTRRRNRKLAMVGLGLGLALLRGKRGLRRYAMARLLSGGFGHGGWGGYGRYGLGDFSQMTIPPFIEARLKAWHDQQHGVPATGNAPGGSATV